MHPLKNVKGHEVRLDFWCFCLCAKHARIQSLCRTQQNGMWGWACAFSFLNLDLTSSDKTNEILLYARRAKLSKGNLETDTVFEVGQKEVCLFVF